MAQGDLRPMSENREAMADLVAILEARSQDYAQAEAQLDTSGLTVEAEYRQAGWPCAGVDQMSEALRIRACSIWARKCWNIA